MQAIRNESRQVTGDWPVTVWWSACTQEDGAKDQCRWNQCPPKLASKSHYPKVGKARDTDENTIDFSSQLVVVDWRHPVLCVWMQWVENIAHRQGWKIQTCVRNINRQSVHIRCVLSLTLPSIPEKNFFYFESQLRMNTWYNTWCRQRAQMLR